jgi:hypothetical protein
VRSSDRAQPVQLTALGYIVEKIGPRAFGGHFGASGLLGQYLDLVKIQFLASASVSKSPM